MFDNLMMFARAMSGQVPPGPRREHLLEHTPEEAVALGLQTFAKLFEDEHVWDGTGLVLASKRPEQGRFAWPAVQGLRRRDVERRAPAVDLQPAERRRVVRPRLLIRELARAAGTPSGAAALASRIDELFVQVAR